MAVALLVLLIFGFKGIVYSRLICLRKPEMAVKVRPNGLVECASQYHIKVLMKALTAIIAEAEPIPSL